MKDNVGKCYISKPGKSSKILKKEPKKMGKLESTVNWNTEDRSAHHICIRDSEWYTRECLHGVKCFLRQPLVQIIIISVLQMSKQKVEKASASHVRHTNSFVL